MIQAAGAPGGLRGVVAIGACARGVEALSRLASGRAADVPYAYLVTLRIPAGGNAAISQSPADALLAAMPTNAIEAGAVVRQAAVLACGHGKGRERR